jgi:hypothetical protein
MISFDDFTNQWNGKGCDVDGYYGFQCYDLAHRYAIDCVGKDIPSRASAKDLWDCDIDGYDKIANTPEGVPSKGDIVIWGTAVGPWGHVAIFSSGDSFSFTSFDQNWPVGTLCHFQQHNYTGVLGWFHPKSQVVTQILVDKITFENLVTKSTKYDKFTEAGYKTVEDVVSKIAGLEEALETAKKDSNKLTGEILQKEEELSIWRNHVCKVNGQNVYSDSDILLNKPIGWPIRVINYVGKTG